MSKIKVSKHTPAIDCNCYYNEGQDEIMLCPLHAAARELLKACKYAFDILMRMPEAYAEAISEETLNGKAIDTPMLEIAISKAEGGK